MFIVESQQYKRVVSHFYDLGYDETIKFILGSRQKQYLLATKDISKIKELVSLTKREKSIVKYLNYLVDKNGTIVPLYSNNISNNSDSTNGAKMSKRQLKHMQAVVDSLTRQEFAVYVSFVGVLELDHDKLHLARVKAKLLKISALYTARLPHCNINFKEVAVCLNSKKIQYSVQDVIAFLSLITELSYDGVNINIPASFWESVFGRRKTKDAKQVFQDLGILKLVSNPIPGFKSAGYKINFFDAQNVEVRPPVDIKITSIRTLEKLNRIISYKGSFTLDGKIEALELIRDLRLKGLKKHGIFNLTNIFLESGKTQILIDDIKRMNEIMNDNRFYHIALPLGIHLTTYFNNINEGHFKDYRALRLKETNEDTI
jgi:hypothetical protein